jgi:hypothetical protein
MAGANTLAERLKNIRDRSDMQWAYGLGEMSPRGRGTRRANKSSIMMTFPGWSKHQQGHEDRPTAYEYSASRVVHASPSGRNFG